MTLHTIYKLLIFARHTVVVILFLPAFKMPEQAINTDFVAVVIPDSIGNPQNSYRRNVCCGLSLKELLIFIIQLLLPLSFGLFTITVTLYQQKVGEQLRLEDRAVARQQREHDLNVSAQQLENDKSIAREQREEDELRRHQDLNISTLQRDLDLHIAERQRTADDANAALQLNLTLEQRRHELEVEQQRYDHQINFERERYLDGVILAYINEVGLLLEKNNGSLTANPTVHALARAKTLNVIEQVGAQRAKILLHFLRDAQQLTRNKEPPNLAGAQLNGLNLSGTPALFPIYNLSLVGMYLTRANFDGLNMSYWNFASAHLENATFRGCSLDGATFDDAVLRGADFSRSDVSSVSFRRSDLFDTIFHEASSKESTLFEYSNVQRSNLSSIRFVVTYERYVFNRKNRIQFYKSNLALATFHNAHFQMVDFEFCNLTFSDFRRARIEKTRFYACSLVSASLVDIQSILYDRLFKYSNLSLANLTGKKANKVQFLLYLT